MHADCSETGPPLIKIRSHRHYQIATLSPDVAIDGIGGAWFQIETTEHVLGAQFFLLSVHHELRGRPLLRLQLCQLLLGVY